MRRKISWGTGVGFTLKMWQRQGDGLNDLPSPAQELLPTCHLQLGPLSQPSQHQGLGRVQSLLFSSPSQVQWDT